jgi:hypothetical protein
VPSTGGGAGAAGVGALSPGAVGGISFASLLVAAGAVMGCYVARRQQAGYFLSVKAARAARAAAAAAHSANPVFAVPAMEEHRGDVAVGSPLWRAAVAQQQQPLPRVGTGPYPLFAAPAGESLEAAPAGQSLEAAPRRSPVWKGASV